MYLKPGKIGTMDEINLLEEQIEKAIASGKLVPPGLHAHLGYLYITNGNYDDAISHFNVEKEKFPESEHFINGLIDRMKK